MWAVTLPPACGVLLLAIADAADTANRAQLKILLLYAAAAAAASLIEFFMNAAWVGAVQRLHHVAQLMAAHLGSQQP